MNDGVKRIKRRNFFSNPRVQLRIILTFAVIALLFAATNWYVSVATLHTIEEQIRGLPLNSTQKTDIAIIAREQELTLKLQLSLQTLAAFVLLGLAGLVISHRIGGPIHQLETYLEDIVSGRTAPRHIKFRAGDFFATLPPRFNAFQSRFHVLDEAEDSAASKAK